MLGTITQQIFLAPEQQGMVGTVSVMRQQNSETPCLTRHGTFQPLEPSKISFQPGVFLKIVFAALVERSYLAASYQNSSSPCFYVCMHGFMSVVYGDGQKRPRPIFSMVTVPALVICPFYFHIVSI